MFTAGRRAAFAIGLTLLNGLACGGKAFQIGPSPPSPAAATSAPSSPAGAPTSAEAEAFMKQVNDEFAKLESDAERASWVKSTYITDDTELIESQAQDHMMEFLARKNHEARRFDGLALAPEIARQFYILKYSAETPAPSDPAERAELASLGTKLDGMYGKGKYCSPKLKGLGKDKTAECLPLEDLSAIFASKRDWDLLLEAWRGRHTTS